MHYRDIDLSNLFMDKMDENKHTINDLRRLYPEEYRQLANGYDTFQVIIDITQAKSYKMVKFISKYTGVSFDELTQLYDRYECKWCKQEISEEENEFLNGQCDSCSQKDNLAWDYDYWKTDMRRYIDTIEDRYEYIEKLFDK